MDNSAFINSWVSASPFPCTKPAQKCVQTWQTPLHMKSRHDSSVIRFAASSKGGSKPSKPSKPSQQPQQKQQSQSSAQVSRPLVERPTPSAIWELDFYSRPVLGPDGKKIWELLITDKDGVLEHVEQIPSNNVNSTELRKRIEKVIASSDVKPTAVRFFRSAMQNMISIALSDLDVIVKPSRRTYTLRAMIMDREKNVYPTMPGYREGLKPDLRLNIVVPQKLPDALRGERYAFVSLPYGVLSELRGTQLDFGELCPVEESMSDSTQVPGLVIFSKRATPIAAWMSGLELAFITADLDKREVLVECDLSTAYLFSKIRPEQLDDAKKFEKTKAELNGLHFISVQESEDSEDINGFWLLRSERD
eukprot:CAMPEP_0184691626 /NCGR_PEP_ID=MMETSP0313-20130426/421_1 /TAXON_ID=2792 /ORGANISM="Porphyridium aerugineum, Strain SAG 1380-2" /LENGTH=362 /DNA_ID=CAMNT_0027149377 /DNA_START=80 /DNA_END=1168 /DNA_ORIENTATION=+